MANEYTITVNQEEVRILEIGMQGPPGPPGVDGQGATTNYTAGETLGGHRAVVFSNPTTVVYADSGNAAHRNYYAGITVGAASFNATVTVQRHGDIMNSGWSWVANAPVYFGASGILTQTPPIGNFIQIIGVATSTTHIFLAPREPIILA